MRVCIYIYSHYHIAQALGRSMVEKGRLTRVRALNVCLSAFPERVGPFGVFGFN
jgi:hypothetical protein